MLSRPARILRRSILHALLFSRLFLFAMPVPFGCIYFAALVVLCSVSLSPVSFVGVLRRRLYFFSVFLFLRFFILLFLSVLVEILEQKSGAKTSFIFYFTRLCSVLPPSFPYSQFPILNSRSGRTNSIWPSCRVAASLRAIFTERVGSSYKSPAGVCSFLPIGELAVQSC